VRQKLFKRLEKLETATARLLDGPWTWPAKEAELKRRTLELMAPEDRAFLIESLEGKNGISISKFEVMYPKVWAKYDEAFERAAREVPAPFPMISAELWGQW